MSETPAPSPVMQLRLVVEVDDYDAALHFYRDVLGLPMEDAFSGPGEARVAILQAGRATLELANPAQKRMIDEVEVGRQVAPRMRVAFEVADSAAVTAALVEAGAALVAAPTETPWRSLNARLDAPAGLHITLFQELGPAPGPEVRRTAEAAPITDDELAAITIGELAPLNTTIDLRPYDADWPRTYEREAAAVRAVLGDRVRLLEHCGSTSVPGLSAKPVIDMVLEVPDSADEPAYVPAMEAAGYVLRIREPDWFEHRLFKGPRANINLHTFSAGCPETHRMLAFRDHLRADPADRALYQREKEQLAARTWRHVQHYADAKSGVVADVMVRALARAGDSAGDPPG